MAPAKLVSLLQEAVAHHRAGRLGEADKIYSRVRAAAPTNFDAAHLSGLVAYQQGRYRHAAELLPHALKLDPKSALCEMRLGLACLALGELAVAEKHFRAAVTRDPGLA